VSVSPPPPEIDADLSEVVLALADDELVIGHRHSEWLGLSPFLEEDLAMASIAQDELGHARALYAVMWPSWSSREAQVTLRPAGEWRCCALVELDARPWERHLVRHVFYDVIEGHRWRSLAEVNFPALAAVAERALGEERWHRRHGVDLLERLGPVAGDRLQTQVDALFPFVGDLMDHLSPVRRADAHRDLFDVITHAGLTAPKLPDEASNDRRVRTAEFSAVRHSLTEVAAIDPSASW
jgi:ring-1,2-phenylacetyl-CoA epoxidase subunit PaaC